MKSENLVLGRIGETEAAEYLESLGYKILERNYKNKIGEIDIIARDGDTLVFVEVKTRSSNGFGYGREAVDFKKQNKIRMTATVYLKYKRLLDSKVRFDVIEINQKLEHYKNAF